MGDGFSSKHIKIGQDTHCCDLWRLCCLLAWFQGGKKRVSKIHLNGHKWPSCEFEGSGETTQRWRSSLQLVCVPVCKLSMGWHFRTLQSNDVFLRRPLLESNEMENFPSSITKIKLFSCDFLLPVLKSVFPGVSSNFICFIELLLIILFLLLLGNIWWQFYELHLVSLFHTFVIIHFLLPFRESPISTAAAEVSGIQVLVCLLLIPDLKQIQDWARTSPMQV